MALNNKSALLGLIERKEFLELGKSLDKNADVPSIELYMQSCPSCQESTSRVTVRPVSKRPTGHIAVKGARIVLAGIEIEVIKKNLAKAPSLRKAFSSQP
jgi:hypothetical protein